MGTPAVIAGVGTITCLQLAFTYLPVMNSLFDTRPIGLADGLVIIGIGAAAFAVLELEKLLHPYYGWLNPEAGS
jgi:hypothetical protein